MLPALTPVGHEVGQPLFTLVHLLFAKGLKKKKHKIPTGLKCLLQWQKFRELLVSQQTDGLILQG